MAAHFGDFGDFAMPSPHPSPWSLLESAHRRLQDPALPRSERLLMEGVVRLSQAAAHEHSMQGNSPCVEPELGAERQRG